jgi:cytidylate kinase
MGVEKGDDDGVDKILDDIDLRLTWSDGVSKVELDGADVSVDIRRPEVSRAVSWVSAMPAVRRKMVALQRKMAEGSDVVLEGRDIGTVVFPDASLKIYMTADLAARADRRAKELDEKGIKVDIESVKKDLARRDLVDSNRKESPLRPADDAIMIDTSGLTIEQQVEKVVSEVEKVRNGNRGELSPTEGENVSPGDYIDK